MKAIKLGAAILTIGAITTLAACSHDKEMTRRETTTTTVTQPPPIVEQHTTTRMEKSDD
jgi:hypothetical protein